MNTFLTTEKSALLPQIVQGGMGIGVSNWQLARSVSMLGGFGVVSGSALGTVMIRRLQDGDSDAHIRRALAHYPDQGVAARIIERWFQPEGRLANRSYRVKALPTFGMDHESLNLIIVGSFVEVFLAREGHEGWIGFNILEKTQVQTLPALFGAMLAGVDAVFMGGGIPLSIPKVLDNFAKMRSAELKLHIAGAGPEDDFRTEFNPREFLNGVNGLKRPLFFPVVSSDVLAMTLAKKAEGHVDGFVVEDHRAGGHNAPPRRGQEYGPKDRCNLEKIANLNLPFWLAGGCASPEALEEAKLFGALGIQAGSIFALSADSGIDPHLKLEIIEHHRKGTLKIVTDFQASPTGYPFKRAEYGQAHTPEQCRVCDLGYLRQPYMRSSGTLGYRCPAAPKSGYVRKGGDPLDAEGKQCLCNGLLATVGLGRLNFDGKTEAPLVTLGDDLDFLGAILKGEVRLYSAAEALAYLDGPTHVQRPEILENLQTC